MSDLRIETIALPVADFGAENPYPALTTDRIAGLTGAGADIPPEMQRNLRYGRLRGLLPYTIQDGYTRQRKLRDVIAAVLENETLRAVFLPEFGGRLWSLVHKPSGRELLYRNAVIQPGNLALRNAWFCGGVEWNTGTTGHTPFTCAPLYTARLTRADGAPILRMYEYERWRGITNQLDACLPDGLDVLLVRVTLANPQPEETAIYWWSNIAVPEARDVRVIVPAQTAFHFDLERSGLQRVPVPLHRGVDYTYTTNNGPAADYFFDIPTGTRPFIAALDGGGRGLVQTSTARLKGRKLFFWGMDRGGQRWQEFLSPEGGRYLEIQAGLANTQLEHLPMPGQARWSWLEAYGLLEADPLAVHGSDWQAAVAAAAGKLERLIPVEELARQDQLGAQMENAPVEELLLRGSGWGALEERRRVVDSEPALGGESLPFPPPAITSAQQPWLSLLENGGMRVASDEDLPVGFVTDWYWQGRLEQSLAAPTAAANWLAWYYLAIMRADHEDYAGAQTALERSLELRRTPWALRSRAVLAALAGQVDEAVQDYHDALMLRPDDIPLWVEFGRFLIDHDRSAEFLTLLSTSLPENVRQWGRIRLLEANAALRAGQMHLLENFFASAVEIADLREGDDALSALWYAYQRAQWRAVEGRELTNAEIDARVPQPAAYDFRMRIE